MAITGKMIASEILICGVKAGIKQIPIVGETAVQVVENLQKRHTAINDASKMAEFEAKLSRVERGMRDTVQNEIRTILGNLSRPYVPGPELTREMTELRQIYEQGWMPNLFEGLLRNSTHLGELRRNPSQYGRILGDDEPVRPENGMHLLLDKDKTRILEMPAASLAFLLGNQTMGIPVAKMQVAQDIWALPLSNAMPISEDLGLVTVPSQPYIPTADSKLSFNGPALCHIGTKIRGNTFSRCRVAVDTSGIKIEVRHSERIEQFNLSPEDLHFGEYTYDEIEPVPGYPPDFKYYIGITIVKDGYHLLLKDREYREILDVFAALRDKFVD